MISSSEVEKIKITEGFYNKEYLMAFLDMWLFQNNQVLIIDNVRSHHLEEIMNYLLFQNVTMIYLPPYSSDLNLIENVFSCIKSRLN